MQLTFPSGSQPGDEQNAQILIISDDLLEENETFSLILTPDSAQALVDGQVGTVVIADSTG